MVQVKHQGNHVSACAVVTGLQRHLFVVPNSSVLAADEELKTLEKEFEADPSQLKGPLMKRLHVSRTFLAICFRTKQSERLPGIGVGSVNMGIHHHEKHLRVQEVTAAWVL